MPSLGLHIEASQEAHCRAKHALPLRHIRTSWAGGKLGDAQRVHLRTELLLNS